MNRITTAIRARIRVTLPKNWRSLSLLVLSMVLLTLTLIMSYAGQSIGPVFLGLGLSVAALLSSFWYGSHPDAGWSDSRKFFSLLATNVILFAGFGFLVTHVQAAGVVFLGLFGVVLSYSAWSLINSNSGWLDLAHEIFKTFLVLLALLGIALTLQGLGSLTGLDLLDNMGRDLADLFGGS